MFMSVRMSHHASRFRWSNCQNTFLMCQQMRFPAVPPTAGRDSPLVTLQFRDYDSAFWQPQLGPVGFQMLQQSPSSFIPTPPPTQPAPPPPPHTSPGAMRKIAHAQMIHQAEVAAAAILQATAAVQMNLSADAVQDQQNSTSPNGHALITTLPTESSCPAGSQLAGKAPPASRSSRTESTSTVTSPGAESDAQGEGLAMDAGEDDVGEETPRVCPIHMDMKRSRL